MEDVGGNARILLVDGDGRLERRLGDELAAAGFEVTGLDAASECIRVVEDDDVDGVVSAYDLPDLDGVRLLRSLRVSYPTLPFVLVPENGSEAVAGDAVAAGVSAYVPGDGDPDTVCDRLRNCLRREGPWPADESRGRYRHLVEVAPVPVNLFDGTGESIWCNAATLDLLGLDSRHELVGRSIFEFVHPDDRALVRKELAEVVERKESVGPTGMRLRTPDGEDRHVLISTVVGRFLGADIGQAVVVDVTPLREAQDELRSERQFVERALDTLADVFYVVDADGAFHRWNEAATEVTGYDGAALASMGLADVVADDDAGRVVASVGRALDAGRDAVEATLVTKHGREIEYEFRSRRLQPDDERGTPNGPGRVVGIARDVSERRERERQLKVLERWLRHNIRNDANIIQGLAAAIGGDGGDDAERAGEIEAVASRLVDQADRERALVELLVNPSDPVTVDVVDAVEEQVRACRERYPSADIAFAVDGGFDAEVVPELADAVRELVENAVEHDDGETPTVRVAVEATGPDTGVVRVVDAGPGIPELEREVLQLDREIDKLHHGSGLGLLFAYWVARVSGGDLALADGDPRGSVVTLTLPRADGE